MLNTVHFIVAPFLAHRANNRLSYWCHVLSAFAHLQLDLGNHLINTNVDRLFYRNVPGIIPGKGILCFLIELFLAFLFVF
jgi:hypothetical protein